jgi:hypothetical protein
VLQLLRSQPRKQSEQKPSCKRSAEQEQREMSEKPGMKQRQEQPRLFGEQALRAVEAVVQTLLHKRHPKPLPHHRHQQQLLRLQLPLLHLLLQALLRLTLERTGLLCRP